MRKNISSALAGFLAALLLWCLLPVTAEAAGASFSGSGSVRAGDSVTVTFSVSGSNIQGITAVLHYDSSALTLTGTRQLIGDSWSVDMSGGNLLAYSITSPLGVKDRLGDLVAIRHPMNGNDDFTINVGNNLAEKTCVIRMEATVDELIASVPDTLEALIDVMPGKPAAFHLVHCGGRRAGIDARIGEVADAVAKVAGDVPYIMEFTFGEYGFESDNNTCGGLMLSFTGFNE